MMECRQWASSSVQGPELRQGLARAIAICPPGRIVPALATGSLRRKILCLQATPAHQPVLGSQAVSCIGSWPRCSTPIRSLGAPGSSSSLRLSAVLPAQEASSSSENAQEHEAYHWHQAWYPVAVTGELDPTRTRQITLLGEDYVLWRDSTGAWRAFADRCPHRLAPLSEGRVESDGTLLCAYHAWRFDGSGACTAIPQARGPAEEQAARANPRACATAFPTREAQGLLWLWPQSGPQAQTDSQNAALPLIEELGTPGVIKTEWRSHELPYSQDYFFENIFDPAHAVVAHHGMVGNRYTDPAPIEFQVVQPLSRDNGFVFQAPSARVKGGVATTRFTPPNYGRIATANPDGSVSTLHLYASPSKPGYCIQIGCQVFIPNTQGKYHPGIKIFRIPLPKWLFHVMGALFLHQDAVFLHSQERIAAMSAYKHKRAVDKYFVPTSSDKMMLTYRRWVEWYSPGGLPYGGEFEGKMPPPIERDHNKLFDTWTSHTKNCVVCQRALARLKAARVASCVVSALAAMQAAVAMSASAAAQAAATGHAIYLTMPAAPALLWGGLAIAAVLAAALLTKLIGMFYLMPFSHADNN